MKKLKLSMAVLAASIFYHGAALSAEHTVEMLNNGAEGIMAFEPAFLKAEKGDTIIFKATDGGHDSVAVTVPEGATAWKGKNSKDISVTLDTEGVYIYKCTPHVMMGMVGVIQVGEATNKAEAAKAVDELSTKIMMNKERLGSYLAKVN